MYYPCSENKGADQLRGYREADLRLCFRLGKNPVFSRCGSNIIFFTCTCNKVVKIENFHIYFFHIFLIFAQNIDCGYTLELPRQVRRVPTIYVLCTAKIRKIGIPLQTPVFLYKRGFKGIYISRTRFLEATD